MPRKKQSRQCYIRRGTCALLGHGICASVSMRPRYAVAQNRDTRATHVPFNAGLVNDLVNVVCRDPWPKGGCCNI